MHCPAAAENKKQHAIFISMLDQLRAEVNNASIGASIKLLTVASDWLVNHIMKIDKQLKK